MPSHDSMRNRVNRTSVFRREGDYWTIAYDAAVVRLRDAKGLRYIEPLLRHPGRSFHVAELIRVADCPDGPRPAVEDGTATAVERARKAVTNRIRQTLARISSVHQSSGCTCAMRSTPGRAAPTPRSGRPGGRHEPAV